MEASIFRVLFLLQQLISVVRVLSAETDQGQGDAAAAVSQTVGAVTATR